MYTIFTHDVCVFCDRAKATLSQLSQEYQEINIQQHKWALDLVKRSGFKTVPQIYSPTGHHIGGYTELGEFLKDQQMEKQHD
jgi:glutaredoxin